MPILTLLDVKNAEPAKSQNSDGLEKSAKYKVRKSRGRCGATQELAFLRNRQGCRPKNPFSPGLRFYMKRNSFVNWHLYKNRKKISHFLEL
jgi:hypothetical protein